MKAIKPEVEAEGFKAFDLGDTLEDNPYHIQDFRFTDWAVGWQRAKLEAEKAEEDEDQPSSDKHWGGFDNGRSEADQ